MSLTDLQNMQPKMNHLLGLRKIDIEDIKEILKDFLILFVFN